MKIRKSDKYKNYGSIPRNEYTTANIKNNSNSVAALEHDAQADNTTHMKHLRKLSFQYPPISGWKRSGKANGWRAELASRQDESIEARRYYNYIVKTPTPINKRKTVNDPKKDVRNEAIAKFNFITEEMNLICIYKADTRRETLSNMQAARSYISDPDMLAVLDNAADKLDNMTDTVFFSLIQ